MEKEFQGKFSDHEGETHVSKHHFLVGSRGWVDDMAGNKLSLAGSATELLGFQHHVDSSSFLLQHSVCLVIKTGFPPRNLLQCNFHLVNQCSFLFQRVGAL